MELAERTRESCQRKRGRIFPERRRGAGRSSRRGRDRRRVSQFRRSSPVADARNPRGRYRLSVIPTCGHSCRNAVIGSTPSQDQNHSLPENDSDNIAALRTERHADSDFVCSPRDRVRDCAVSADHGEDEGKDRDYRRYVKENQIGERILSAAAPAQVNDPPARSQVGGNPISHRARHDARRQRKICRACRSRGKWKRTSTCAAAMM
jgi:hypothetical protein